MRYGASRVVNQRYEPKPTRFVLGGTSEAIFEMVPRSGRKRMNRVDIVEPAIESATAASESVPRSETSNVVSDAAKADVAIAASAPKPSSARRRRPEAACACLHESLVE